MNRFFLRFLNRLTALVLFCLIVSNVSARNKIVSVKYEVRVLEYAFMTHSAEYHLQGNQLVLDEQPGNIQVNEVVDPIRLDSLVYALVKHKGQEIKHERFFSSGKKSMKKKSSDIPFSPSLLSHYDKTMFHSAVTITQEKGYILIGPDYTNQGQYMMYYKGKFFAIPDSEWDLNSIFGFSWNLSEWEQ